MKQLRPRLSLLSHLSQDARGKGDEAGAGRQQTTEDPGRDAQRAQDRDNIGDVDVDGQTVESGNVEQLSTVEDRDTEVLALVQKLLAVIDGAGAGGGGTTPDDDSGAIEQCDVEELGTVGDANAEVFALIEELLAIVDGGRGWFGGGSGLGAGRGFGRRFHAVGNCKCSAEDGSKSENGLVTHVY